MQDSIFEVMNMSEQVARRLDNVRQSVLMMSDAVEGGSTTIESYIPGWLDILFGYVSEAKVIADGLLAESVALNRAGMTPDGEEE
jgi:hypothetical protein